MVDEVELAVCCVLHSERRMRCCAMANRPSSTRRAEICGICLLNGGGVEVDDRR
jgi:hypothetical protein